jgi:divalent metal cation (Fe/Co/Zn/Cd) transporter
LVWLSQRLGPEWGWLAKGDAGAALVVAGIVVYVSLQLGRRAVTVLLDVAPPGLAERIAAEARQVPGVLSLGPARLRQAGASIFVDLVIEVERSASLEEAHEVAERVSERIGRIVPRGDVVVHVDPVRGTGESLTETVTALAARLGLHAHNIHAHEVRGRVFVDLHIEVPSDLTLGQAHDRVSRLEVALREELPDVRDIHSHIEPLAVPAQPAPHLDDEKRRQIEAQIEAIVKEVPGLGGASRLHIRPGPGGYDIVLHCLADPDLPITEAHRLADQVEKRVHVQIPGVNRVLVHVEPEGEMGGPEEDSGAA